MSGIRILGTGSYLPVHVVTNEDFTAIMDTSDEWIQTRTGMKQRRFVREETTWSLGARAARAALETAGKDPMDVDLIIVTTVTPDYYYPSTACIIQEKLGARGAFAFDVSAACAGFSYGMDMARRYLCCGDVKTVLLINAETLSLLSNFEDRSTAILFGDGAGACVLERGEGAFSSFLHSDSAGGHHVYCKHHRATVPFFGEEVHDTLPFPIEVEGKAWMNGREVYKFATRAMPLAVRKACERMEITPEDLDWIIPHQANLRILEASAKNMKIPMDKMYINIQEYGNTSSASVSICLDEGVRAGRIRRGDLVCAVGFGAGLTYGACIFEY